VLFIFTPLTASPEPLGNRYAFPFPQGIAVQTPVWNPSHSDPADPRCEYMHMYDRVGREKLLFTNMDGESAATHPPPPPPVCLFCMTNH
jgi:hypothetical protein